VGGTGKARHIDADLRHHDLRGEVTHSGQSRQEAGATVDRRQGFSHVSIDLAQGLLERCNELQMHLQQPPVVRLDTPVQSCHQLGAFLSSAALSEIGELLRVVLSGNEGVEDRPARDAQYVREDAPELYIGVLESFLDPQGVLGDLPHQLLAGACEITQLLDRPRGHEARTDQPVRQQVRDPGGIVHVGLASGDVTDVLGVGEHQLKVLFQQMPHRLPVHPRGFHRHMGHAVAPQPLIELEQGAGGRRKAAHLIG